jgi:hypothetical protein
MALRPCGQAMGEAHYCVRGEEASERIQDCSVGVDLCRWEEEGEVADR